MFLVILPTQMAKDETKRKPPRRTAIEMNSLVGENFFIEEKIRINQRAVLHDGFDLAKLFLASAQNDVKGVFLKPAHELLERFGEVAFV